MNSEPRMLTKKLDMLAFALVTNEQKVSWLKFWNQFDVLKKQQNFQNMDSWMELLISGFTRRLSGLK